MRVRIVQAPAGSVDGIALDKFSRGAIYDVGTIVGNYLLAAGYAEPADDDAPMLTLPLEHPIALQWVRRDPDTAEDPRRKRLLKARRRSGTI